MAAKKKAVAKRPVARKAARPALTKKARAALLAPSKAAPQKVYKPVNCPTLDDLQINLSSEHLTCIVALARRQFQLEDELAQMNEQVAAKARALDFVVSDLLPSAFDMAGGLKSFKLNNGYEVGIETFVTANIKEEDRAAAHEWLRKNKYGSLIKNVVAVPFGMGEEKAAKKLLAMLKKLRYSFSTKEQVASATLRAFARESLAEGRALPPTIGIFTVPKSIIKRPKNV